MVDKASKVTIALVASIVVACFSAIIGLIGLIGRNSYAPKIVDEAFGLSTYVLSEINKRVDSGYSGTFIFSQNSLQTNGQILFYAEPEQEVRVTIDGHSTGATPAKFKVLVDGQPWKEAPLPFRIVGANVTKALSFDVEPGGDMHVLKIFPEDVNQDTVIVIDCIVVVYNKPR